MPEALKFSDHIDGDATIAIMTHAMRRCVDGTDWQTALAESIREARRHIGQEHAKQLREAQQSDDNADEGKRNPLTAE